MKWKLINTAPTAEMKPGASVLLFIPGHGDARAYFKSVDGVNGIWICWHSGKQITKATHWMPCPRPPIEELRDELADLYDK